MSDEKVLTKEIAEQWIADEDSVDLREFTAIEDEAAAVLSDEECHMWVDLGGLTNLSGVAGRLLARGARKHELIIGLAVITAEEAKYLFDFRGGLRLDNLSNMPESDEFLERLSMAKCESLSLGGLTRLTVTIAEAFPADCSLNLNGLKSMSDEVVDALISRHVYLEGLTELSNDAAETLAGKIEQRGWDVNAELREKYAVINEACEAFTQSDDEEDDDEDDDED